MNKILILFLSLLPCAAVFCQDSLPVIPDEEYRLACGPIAGLIALESLGVATDLPEIASRCHWVKDKMLPLSDLCNGISSYTGIECKSAQLSPLFSHLVNDATPLLKGEWIVVIGKQGCAECEALVRDFLPKHRNVALLVLKEGETAYTPPEGLGFYSEFEIEQTSVFLVPCALRCLDGVCLELLGKEE